MSDRVLHVLAQALPVDPDDGTMPTGYIDLRRRDASGLAIREWGLPETVARWQLAALTDAGLVVVDTRDTATAEMVFDLLHRHERRSRAAESASPGGTAFGCSCGVVRRWRLDEMPTSGDSLHQEHVVKAVLAALAKGTG